MLHCPAKSHNQHAPHAHALLMTCLRLRDQRPARHRPSPQPKPTRAVLLAPHCTESISNARRSHKHTRAAQPACATAHTRSPHSVHTCATCVLRDLSPPRMTRAARRYCRPSAHTAFPPPVGCANARDTHSQHTQHAHTLPMPSVRLCDLHAARPERPCTCTRPKERYQRLHCTERLPSTRHTA